MRSGDDPYFSPAQGISEASMTTNGHDSDTTTIEQVRGDILAKTEGGFPRAREAEAQGIYPYFTPFADSEGTIVYIEGVERLSCWGRTITSA